MADITINITTLDETQVLADLNRIAQELGVINEINETSNIYIYYSVFARVFGNIAKIVTQYLSELDISTTTDEALLEILIKPFVTKRQARVAKVILEFYRREESDNANDILIPTNFEVTTEGNNPIVFRTAESRILWKDSYRVKIPAYSVDMGANQNVSPNTLTFFEDSTFADIGVTNPNAAFGGRDEESAFDARNRIENFRYARDGSIADIGNRLVELGVGFYDYNIVEYFDGYGTLLIVIDIASDEEFKDIIRQIDNPKIPGVKYSYTQVEKIPVDMDISLKLTGENLYNEYDKETLENHIVTAIEIFIGNYCYIGQGLSVKRLEAYILNYVVDAGFEIYELDVDILPNEDLTVNPQNGKFEVKPYQRIQANKVSTVFEYNLE